MPVLRKKRSANCYSCGAIHPVEVWCSGFGEDARLLKIYRREAVDLIHLFLQGGKVSCEQLYWAARRAWWCTRQHFNEESYWNHVWILRKKRTKKADLKAKLIALALTRGAEE